MSGLSESPRHSIFSEISISVLLNAANALGGVSGLIIALWIISFANRSSSIVRLSHILSNASFVSSSVDIVVFIGFDSSGISKRTSCLLGFVGFGFFFRCASTLHFSLQYIGARPRPVVLKKRPQFLHFMAFLAPFYGIKFTV